MNAPYLWEKFTKDQLENAAIVMSIYDEKNGGEVLVGEVRHPLLNSDERINAGNFVDKLPDTRSMLDFTINYGALLSFYMF